MGAILYITKEWDISKKKNSNIINDMQIDKNLKEIQKASSKKLLEEMDEKSEDHIFDDNKEEEHKLK